VGNGGSSREREAGGQLRPLHGGRHSIPADILAHNQRERLIAGLASTVAERGYNAATIAQIAEAASVSKRTFYEHFANKEECFLAAYEALDDYLATVLAEAFETEDEWPDQVTAAAAALISFLASRPNFARLYLVEAAVVGEAMSAPREATAARLIALLEPGRRYRGVDPEMAEGMEEGLVGGILTLLGRRVMSGEAERLERFTPAVIEFALAPYLGSEEARVVIERHS
jgi:AcrR family transcriptional regulator